MREDWELMRLGDLAAIEHGWPFKSEEFSEELTGKPIVVAVGNFRYDGGFRFDSTTTKEYRGDYPKSYELVPGDTLLIMTCQTPGGEILGIPARVPDDGRKYLHNQRLGKVVVRNPEKVDPSFLYYLFRSQDFNQALCATASGSKILHTAPTRIEAYKFRCPPIHTQREIASTLGALDDKIEQNRRTGRALEGLARATFKAWFVDFEPVKAKAAGQTSFPGMPAAAFAALPDRLTDSPLGPIPQGWEVGKLGDLLSERGERIAPSDETQLLPYCPAAFYFPWWRRSIFPVLKVG
jgi:type I restriction enzyme S subunit